MRAENADLRHAFSSLSWKRRRNDYEIWESVTLTLGIAQLGHCMTSKCEWKSHEKIGHGQNNWWHSPAFSRQINFTEQWWQWSLTFARVLLISNVEHVGQIHLLGIFNLKNTCTRVLFVK